MVRYYNFSKSSLVKLSVLAILALVLLPASVFADTTDLVAGQNIDVGDVIVESDGLNLYVTFTTTGDWFMSATHLHLDEELGGIPQRRGNPIPGQFLYQTNHDPVVQDYTYVVEGAGLLVGAELFIAAHAVIQEWLGEETDTTALASSPAGTVNMKVAFPGGDSYFNTTITGLGLDGTYDGFCIDTDRAISPGSNYTATVFSSYDPAAAGLVEKPWNFDLVNYIINQGYVGQASPSGGTYTYGDVQRTLWTLIDDQVSTAGLGSWSQARVDEIIADATANGEGFVPDCGDVMAVVLNPIDASGSSSAQITIAQITLVEYGVPCLPIYEKLGTAWGAGYEFSGKNWALYFTYTVPNVE